MAQYKKCPIHETVLNAAGDCFWCQKQFDESHREPLVEWHLTRADKDMLKSMRIKVDD